ncbi:ADP-ribose pyrophosphatase, mitochondrial [Tribolium madens]|uniref:ADP-ribose pyrophosphatase, mitochondrial n=1 Tax=Tribolium madens TaxID=41895 RepID=UPI001CF75CE7|nr:ADP-ribose pyrophosphatase, mitochondrial [Tribolium madens]
MVHIKCRTGLYPFSEIRRFVLTDAQIPWAVPVENYSPPDYDSPVLHNKPWADPPCDDPNFRPKWNALDGKTNRKSHTGPYKIIDGRPLNPEGRTGLKGRGVLGKWGPNHAADPVVTRWKSPKELHPGTKLPILQFCAIQRRDCGQWAIPGGMVDPGESVSETLKREFLEEAFNSLENSDKANEEMISGFFSKGEEIFKGYVDDPRNTDNAWMETVAVNFHDDNNTTVGKFKLQAGDDAKNVKWIDIDSKLDLYASHSNFIQAVAKLRQAHW